MKVLLIGDMHFRNTWHHAEEFEDRRIKERETIERAIIEAAKPCDHVIQLGDFLDARDNPSSVVRHAVEFLERLNADRKPDNERKVTILSGNHASWADGRAAEDFINEVTGKNWRFVNEICKLDGIAYVPYVRRQQFGVETDAEVVQKVLESIDGLQGCGAILIHHAVGGTVTTSGQMTDTFHEPVFPMEALTSRAAKVFAGHIHKPQDVGNFHLLGSIMNHDVGETDVKRVIRWDTVTGEIESIPLPGRKLAKLVDPTPKEIEDARGKYDLVRVITSKPLSEEALKGLGEVVQVVEKPKESRRRSGEITDFSLTNLLAIYGKERDVPVDALMRAFQKVESQ